MAEVTRVWVRTSVLDVIVFGKVRSTNERASPGSCLEDEGDVYRNWGWARGELAGEDLDSVMDSVDGAGKASSGSGSGKAVRVLIKDADSQHNGNEVEIAASQVKEGGLLMANTYGLGEEDDGDGDNDDGGYYGYDDGVDVEPDQDRYPDDLIGLTHLHEPSVVYSLRKRYLYDKIYTATGPILIAINPFKHCHDLYSDNVMQTYYNRGDEAHTAKDDQQQPLPPHVYQIADHSFRIMLNNFNDIAASNATNESNPKPAARRRPNTNPPKKAYNQSILVSGESGAGKTVTTKYIMKYLATLSKRSDPNRSTKSSSRRVSLSSKEHTNKADIEQQVLQSNPILESFGNARTIRNDNSSRFGKFIEIQFTTKGTLIGASVETYLLEKVRLVTQATGERNYHIFYELLEGMDEEHLQKYFLHQYTAEHFRMTNQSGTYDRRDGVTDYDTYQDLITAMDTVGLDPQEQQDMISIPCALLHASNITFTGITADECQIDRSNQHLQPVLSLLGVSADALNRALCYFSITAGRETHLRSLSKEKAEKGLLALIKATYGALFTHIVHRVNQSIASKDLNPKLGRRGATSATPAAYIGVLDIFGFESFRFNSFEQLCINYCNEALQQQFNLFVLKNEQEEYDREGIQWSFISFPDNQDVLDLIYKKGAGILNILDDQCRAPGTTDKTFVNDLYQKLSRHSRFQADFRQVGNKQFAIIHYAGTVEYSSEGFVEKNRDELPKEATDLLLSSSNKFVTHLAQILSGSNSSPTDNQRGNRSRPSMSARPKKLTVGGQFSQQLHELRQKIDETSPHYVRCLKPNDELVPDHFDPVVIADQLRCAGVIEAVRVSRVGYPQRYTHAMFVARYRILGIKALKQAARSSRRKKPVEVIVQTIASRIAATDESTRVDESQTPKRSQTPESQVDLVSVGIQVGKTKVFLRRKAYEIIEGLRNREMRGAAVKIQSIGRTYIAHMDYKESRAAVVIIQNWARMVFAKRVVNDKRCHYNATLIQTVYRKFVHNRNYLCIRVVSIWLQRLQRGRIGRRRYQVLNRERKSIFIQKVWRLNRYRKQFQKMKRAAIVVQCAARCRFAKRLFRELRAKARDIHNIAEERDKLQVEVQRLRKAYDKACVRAATAEANSKDKSAQDQIKELSQEISKLKEEVTKVHAENDSQTIRAEDAIKKTSELSIQLECMENENNELSEQMKTAVASVTKKDQEIHSYSEEVKMLKEKLEQLSTKHDVNLEKEIKLLAKEMTSLLRENTKLKKALALEKEKLQSATNSCAEKDAKISAFEQEKSVLEKEIENGAQLRQENQILKETVTNSRMELETATVTCTNRGEEMSSYKQEIEKLKDDLDDVLSENDTYKKQIKEAKDKVDQIREESTILKKNLEQVQCELKDAKVDLSHATPSSPSSPSPSISTEVVKLQKQNENLQREVFHLREELQETSSKASIPNDQKATKEVLNREIEVLRKEKESLTENVNTLSRRVAIEKKANDELNVIIDAGEIDSYNGRPSSPMFSVGSESYADEDKEVLLLEEKITRLKKDLDDSRKSEVAIRTEKQNEVDDLRKALKDSEKKSIEEILTLQDEVQYLNDELRNVKEGNGSNPMGGKQSPYPNEQVGKLINSNLMKDEEIRDLRHELAILKDQIHSVPQSIGFEHPNMAQTVHDDERSVVSRLFGQLSSPHTSGTDKDYVAVKRINESLMKEVEDLKKKCRDYEVMMEDEKERHEELTKEVKELKKNCREYKDVIQDEKERSEQEIEAFGMALKGVDELRLAAEEMSREITRLKCNPQSESNNEHSSNLIQRMEKAKRTIDISALKSTKLNNNLSLWGKVTQSFALAKPAHHDDNFTKESEHIPRRRKRRTRKRDGDDFSIFSALF